MVVWMPLCERTAENTLELLLTFGSINGRHLLEWIDAYSFEAKELTTDLD